MQMLARHLNSPSAAAAEFATTHWSVVLAARQTTSARADEALAELCKTYWYPLYACVRRKGHDAHEAQDLTQEFFARLLEKNFLRAVDRERGRFRSFLLTALNHFLNNHWDRTHRVKRGGEYSFVSWDEANAEQRYRQEPADLLTAEKIFERRWALMLLEQALEGLRKEYQNGARADLFDALQIYLSGEGNVVSYAEMGSRLGMAEGAVKVAVHRLRRRFAEVVRAEIAHTVAEPEAIEDEIRHLFAVLSG